MNWVITGLIVYGIITTIFIFLYRSFFISEHDEKYNLLHNLEYIQDNVKISNNVKKMWDYYHKIDAVIFQSYHKTLEEITNV